MWLDKVSDGVLRVLTPLGARYIKPTFWQRVYLLWMFRHFDSLPHQVLRPAQQQLVDKLCSEHDFVSVYIGVQDAPILGTVERRPLVPSVAGELEPSAQGRPTAVSRLVADAQQRS